MGSEITYSLFKNIENYAKLHTESSKEYYSKRNQDTSKLFEHCFRGKMAEYCCYFSMIKAGYIIQNEPDLKILEQSEKSYDADLVCIGKGKEIYDSPRYIHVKSVSAESFARFGASFLIESCDELVHSPKENHYISVMLEIDLINYEFYKWLDATQIKWDKPILKHLRTKSAWYDR